jgi:hypothetical protein
MTPEEKTIQLLSALVHSMELELVQNGVESHISLTAKAISHRIKVEYMQEKGIKDFDEVEKLFHELELTKTFRTAMVQLKLTWQEMKGK